MLKSASHCYGSHLHFELEDKASTRSLILLSSPSVPGGRYVRNLHWLYQASPDKMKTLRKNAYAKCDTSSISEPILQLWEEQVSTTLGIRHSTNIPVLVIRHLVSHSPPGCLVVAGNTLQCCLCCPLHCSHCGSLRMPFPPLLCLRRQRTKY